MARPQLGALPGVASTIDFGDSATAGSAGDNAALESHVHGMATIADGDVPSTHSGSAHHAESHTLGSHSDAAIDTLTINVALNPDADNGASIGTQALSFQNIYSDNMMPSAHLSNTSLGSNTESWHIAYLQDHKSPANINWYPSNTLEASMSSVFFGPSSDAGLDLGRTATRWNTTYTDRLTAAELVTDGRTDVTAAGGINNQSTTDIFSVYINPNGANRDLTGLAGGTEGKHILIVNKGTTETEAIWVRDQHASSTDTNRFDLGKLSILALHNDESALFVYDGTASRWRLVKPFSSTPPWVKVYRSTTQGTATGTAEEIVYNATSYDDWAMHPGSSTDVTPALDGVWLVIAQTSWAGNSSGARQANIRMSGSEISRQRIATSGGSSTRHTVMAMHQMADTDTVSVDVLQSSGGALNVNSGASETFLILFYMGEHII